MNVSNLDRKAHDAQLGQTNSQIRAELGVQLGVAASNAETAATSAANPKSFFASS
jgi:hypothetical protein